MSGQATEADRLARVALSTVFEPGDLRVASLVAELGAAPLLQLLLAEQDARGTLSDATARLDTLDLTRQLDVADRLGIRFVVPGDAEWPTACDELAYAEPVRRVGGPPWGLWLRGPLNLADLSPSVAVVGSRSATSYGAEIAASISATVAAAGHPVVSGAAFGVDQAAHRGALTGGGLTVAILACGVDRAYPSAHRQLLLHLAQHGLVVSELPPGRSPTRLRFLSRNRVIAALATATVVVEAAARSGALSTATWASRLNRSLLGVPGPVTSATSQGVHQLVRTGAATLVTCGEEVLEVVGGSGQHLPEEPRGPVRARDRLTQRQQQVLEAVPVHAPAASDSISRAAGIGVVEVRSTLDHLARTGLVECTGVGWRLARRSGPE